MATQGRKWRVASFFLAGLVIMPLAVLLWSWTDFDPATWAHLYDTMLFGLLTNSALLLLGVGIGVVLLGVSLAWFTTMCEFPGRRFFDWALMMPFAMPAYVLAFVFLGLADFSGPLQASIRAVFSLPPNWYFEVRNTTGVVIVMSLVFYPYVYMLTRSAFQSQGFSGFEAARTLGENSWGAFYRVVLPMARPGIIAGLSLSLMETLADFGTVSVFNYSTFTTAIYKAWFGLFDINAAAQLASLLLIIVVVALTMEKYSRGRAQYYANESTSRNQRIHFSKPRSWLVTIYASIVLFFAFVAPLIQLLVWGWESMSDLDQRYWNLLFHTVALGVIAALLTTIGAFILAYTRRYYSNGYTRATVQLGTLGYALPGSVLAVGIMISLVWLDNQIADGLSYLFNYQAELLISGSIVTVLIAYMTRFLAVAYAPLDTSLSRISPSLREAAQTLGASGREVISRIYIPILTPGMLTAALLVLVDVMKEMPATMLLRPFGWDTFAVRIYELTSEGEWERAALPAITLIVVGLIPVIMLVRKSARQ